MKKYIAECLGTFVLTFLGCGTAMFLGCNTPAGVVGTAIAFGLTVVAMAYTIGGISGCHINPAITLGVALSGRMSCATFLFVLVVLGTTDSKVGAGNLAGLAIGLTLILVHLVCINLTGTSVNPARSIGPALFAGGAALQDLWVFICAPLVGGALSAAVWKAIAPAK